MPDGPTEPDAPRPRDRSPWARISASLAGVVARLRPTPEQFRRYAASFAIAIAAGLVFTWARLPLPWLLGPLAISFILCVSGRPLSQPSWMVLPVRSLLGVAIGSSFTPDLVGKAWATALSLALLVPYMLAITWAGALFLRRAARFDSPTAFFSAAPGGLADMLIFATGAGADLRRVTLIQAVRVCSIVFILPFWLQFVGGLPLGGAMPETVHVWQVRLVDAAAIVLMAWAGWRIAERLGMLGGSIVGPMALSAIAHVLGLTTAKVPLEVLILAQVSLGILVGGHFKGISLREFVTVASWGFALSVFLIVSAAAMALVTARLTGLDPTSLLLSYAPGGQNEMAIMALILGIDVAIIALHHLLRVMIVIVGAQLVYKSHPEWQGRGGPPGP